MPFSQEGPTLESLQHRLTEIPGEWLEVEATAALLHDTLRLLGASPTATQLAAWRAHAATDNQAVLPLLCWLLSGPEFQHHRLAPTRLWALFTQTAPQLARQARVRHFLTDPDRREELIRLALTDLDLRPAGETVAQAQDRLTSISSLERERVLEAARAAEARTREIREALQRKAAQEGADKWARE